MNSPLLVPILITVIYLTSIYMHLAKKNNGVAGLYALQSVALVLLFVSSFLANPTVLLFLVIVVSIIVKVILAPRFFNRLVTRHKVKFTVSSYANTPVTLIVIMFITAFVNSDVFLPITDLSASNSTYVALAIAAMLVSIFLMVNRKSALSQIVGVLSLENSIVAFGIIAGLEQSALLQLGTLFDIFVWMLVATVFVSMVYRHTGSLVVTTMRHLKD
ncbi:MULTISPECIES: hypothetical protein [unclassified Cryobacterium]|uniref:hypothetical protein n=1 Tax=unclassified Cryobacterium TaxID=2649013 RepID=UPI000CE31A76|nr:MULTISPECIES: hypothetical protein [unclassified Cryobacterium]